MKCYDRDCLFDAFANAVDGEFREGPGQHPRRGVLFQALGDSPTNPACGWVFVDHRGRLEVDGEACRPPSDSPALWIPAGWIWTEDGMLMTGVAAPWKAPLAAMYAEGGDQ